MDSEGDSSEEWCKQVLACLQQSQNQLKLVTQIVRAFVNNCEFKEAQYRGLQTENMVEQYFESKQQVAAVEDGAVT